MCGCMTRTKGHISDTSVQYCDVDMIRLMLFDILPLEGGKLRFK